MSFRCDSCGQPQPRGTSPKKVLVGVQSVSYEVYTADQRRGARRDDIIPVSKGEGFEAICGGEKKLCARCAPANPGKPEIVGHRQDPVRRFMEKDPRREPAHA